MLPRRFKTGRDFTYALDMWSLGCLLHELLTLQTPFLEPDTNDDFDDLSDVDIESGPQIDMESLYEYCQDTTAFPVDVLVKAHVPPDEIDLVKRLLIPNSHERPTATRTLQHPWLLKNKYESPWFKTLSDEFAQLGVTLDLLGQPALVRQLRDMDIVRCLPSTDLPGLLEAAFAQRCEDVVAALLRSPCEALVPPRGRFLRLAVEEDWMTAAEMLLADRTDVDAMVDSGTALDAAARRGNVNMVRLLLDKKASVNGLESTALHASVEGGHGAIVKLLLAAGAAVTGDRATLRAAAQHGHTDIVSQLLAAGANVNAFSNPTALQAAVGGGYTAIVGLILSSGAEWVEIELQPATEGGYR